jgi:hypothetical protein
LALVALFATAADPAGGNGSMRRGVAVAAACATLLLAAGFAAAATATPDRCERDDDDPLLALRPALQVAPGETVRFVVTNTDRSTTSSWWATPDRQSRRGPRRTTGPARRDLGPGRRDGRDDVHVPDELEPGWEFACHLPGIRVRDAGPITLG